MAASVFLPGVRCVIACLALAAAGASAQDLRGRIESDLAARGLGREALEVIGNVLAHDAPAPRGAAPLVLQLLKDPPAAADAAAIFNRAVPQELRLLADPGVATASEFDALLQRYLGELARARGLLSKAVQPLDEARILAVLGAGPSDDDLRLLADAVEPDGLAHATELFFDATARFIAALRSPGVRIPAPQRFTAEIGTVVIGSPGADRHGSDAALIIDPGGDDVYERAPALAGAISVIIDLGGNDRYTGSDVAVRALSALVDISGDDVYELRGPGLGAAAAGAAALIDLDGDDRYQAPAFSQGAALFGVGALVDRRGNDRYRVQAFGQGYGGPGGFGLLWDRAGNDRYVAEGAPDLYGREGGVAFAQGAAAGERTRFAGGIGILRDDAGADHYEAQMFSQGAGYYYGIGLLWDGGGSDEYRAVRYAQGAGVHQAVGVLRDESGRDRYTLGAGVGQGAGQDLAVGVLFDGAGDDIYAAIYDAQGTAFANGFGLLADEGGTNEWRIGGDYRSWGRATWRRGLPSVGVLLGEGRFLRAGAAISPIPSRATTMDAENEASRPCASIPPAVDGGSAPLEAMLYRLAPQLYGRPDAALYGAVLRRLIDDPARALAEISPESFTPSFLLDELLRCAYKAASDDEARRMTAALTASLGVNHLGAIADAFFERPAPPEALSNLRKALDSSPRCGLRALALTRFGSAEDATRALGDSCWRLKAAALERLSALGASAPGASLPAFLQNRGR